MLYVFFFFDDTATTEIYPLSLHDALPISGRRLASTRVPGGRSERHASAPSMVGAAQPPASATSRSASAGPQADRKSTRLNSSHANISYAVFCLKKKKVHPLLLPLSSSIPA